MDSLDAKGNKIPSALLRFMKKVDGDAACQEKIGTCTPDDVFLARLSIGTTMEAFAGFLRTHNTYEDMLYTLGPMMGLPPHSGKPSCSLANIKALREAREKVEIKEKDEVKERVRVITPFVVEQVYESEHLELPEEKDTIRNNASLMNKAVIRLMPSRSERGIYECAYPVGDEDCKTFDGNGDCIYAWNDIWRSLSLSIANLVHVRVDGGKFHSEPRKDASPYVDIDTDQSGLACLFRSMAWPAVKDLEGKDVKFPGKSSDVSLIYQMLAEANYKMGSVHVELYATELTAYALNRSGRIDQSTAKDAVLALAKISLENTMFACQGSGLGDVGTTIAPASDGKSFGEGRMKVDSIYQEIPNFIKQESLLHASTFNCIDTESAPRDGQHDYQITVVSKKAGLTLRPQGGFFANLPAYRELSYAIATEWHGVGIIGVRNEDVDRLIKLLRQDTTNGISWVIVSPGRNHIGLSLIVARSRGHQDDYMDFKMLAQWYQYVVALTLRYDGVATVRKNMRDEYTSVATCADCMAFVMYHIRDSHTSRRLIQRSNEIHRSYPGELYDQLIHYVPRRILGLLDDFQMTELKASQLRNAAQLKWGPLGQLARYSKRRKSDKDDGEP